MTQTWIIEPHDSFIARDGRPFGLIPGVRAASLPFPFPSTTTGGVRTRDGSDAQGVFDIQETSRVKGLTVRGPLLVQLDQDSQVAHWFANAPADALLLDTEPADKDNADVRRLLPQVLPTGAHTNLPDKQLLPLYLQQSDKRKPHGYAPRFWNWERFLKWLRAPQDEANLALADIGTNGPPRDERSHVSIQNATQTHEEGGLFQTRGLEFTKQKAKDDKGDYKLETAARLALAVSTDAAKINDGVAPLGGERRLVSWRTFKPATGVADWLNSQCPISDQIVADRACRVVLLTPACFAAGWKPEWLINGRAGVSANGFTIKLKAAAMGRAQVISGWDFEKPGPKPTRRLVPAGAVFFLKLQSNDDEDIKDWIKNVWMRCVSDAAIDQRDGFGLAALGVWPEGKDVN